MAAIVLGKAETMIGKHRDRRTVRSRWPLLTVWCCITPWTAGAASPVAAEREAGGSRLSGGLHDTGH
jgi:hypothetical protein